MRTASSREDSATPAGWAACRAKQRIEQDREKQCSIFAGVVVVRYNSHGG